MDTDALSALGDRVYGYSSGPGWVSSPYTRIIQVGAITDGGVPVTVTVSWDSYLTGSLEHKEVTLQSWVYDQYERFE